MLKRKKNYPIIHYIFLFIIHSSFKESTEYFPNYLYKESIVKLVLKPGNNQNILSSSYYGTLPNQIIVNGHNLSPISKTINNYLDSVNYNNITLVWTNRLSSCENMFNSMTNIISLDMSKFDFSNVNSMAYMFNGCSSLKYLNLDNIKTSSVTAMYNLFTGCSSLTYLNLYSLDTSNVGCLCNIFNGCSSLLYLNMINVKDPQFCAYGNIFANCNPNLKYTINKDIAPRFANLLNTYTLCIYIKSDFYDFSNDNCFLYCIIGSSNGNSDNCLYKCYNYYDFSKIECFKEFPEGHYPLEGTNNKIISKCSENCKRCDSQNRYYLCTECNRQSNYYQIMNNTDNSHFSCANETPEGFYFESNSYKPCYPTCKFCSKYGNETNHDCTECYQNRDLIEENCLEHCDGYYYFNSSLHEYLCVEKCPEIYVYSKGKMCKIFCKTKELFTKVCKVNEPNLERKDMITNKIKDSILNGELDDIIDDVINQKNDDLFFQLPDTIYQITSSENQNNNKNEYNDTSIIQIGNCERILRAKYNFNDNDKIIIYKIDVNEEDCNIPLINYEFYNIRTKEKLNLSLCYNSTLKVYLPANNVDENNLKKYNKSSEFYNDICYPYSENGLDITNKDRKQYYNDRHLSLCGADCEYQGYDIDTKKSECDCNHKLVLENISSIIQNKEKLIDKFTNIKGIFNLNIAKCYKELFTINGLINNIGSYILLVMIILNLICLISFLVKGYKLLIKTIHDLVEKKKNKVKIENVETSNKRTTGRKNNDKNKLSSNIAPKTKINKYNKGEKNRKIKKMENNSNKKYKKDKKIIDIKIVLKKLKSKNIKNSKHFHFQKLINKDKKSFSNYNSSLKSIDFISKQEKVKLKLNKYNKKSSLNEFELENLSYKMALKLDKRTYCNYYTYLLGRGQLLLFTFITKNDYNIRSLKISMFITFLSLSYAINILFFTDDSIHDILKTEGAFDILNELPKILYSSLISSVANIIIVILALSENNILQLKNSNKKIDKSVKMTKKILKIKFMFFFLLGFLLLFISWYYVSCFCLIYKNTQLYAIKDTAFNFGLSLIYPFGFCLIPGIFRIASLRAKRKNREKMYKFSKFIRDIII